MELEVEPVDRIERAEDVSIPTGIDGPEYILFGGKGGVGKTTMAAANGLASATGGTSTLVISTDPAHSLSDVFAADVGGTPTRIEESIPLHAVEIDTEAAFDDASGSGFGADFGDIFGDIVGDASNPLGDVFAGPMPGADEVLAMHQLLRYLDDDRFDRIVIDTAPTGHTLRLLELPELMDSMLGRFIQFQRRIRDMFEGMKGMFSGEPAETGTGGVELSDLREQVVRLRTALQNPDQTDFRIVMVPEEMSIIESERLREQLRSFEIPVSTVIVNRVMENLGAVIDVDPDLLVSPDLAGCSFCQERWRVQQVALERAQDLFRTHSVKRVPLFAREVRGKRMLTIVASCLD